MREIHKYLATDLKSKMAEKKVTMYEICKVRKICSDPTIRKIISGNGGGTIPMRVIIEIYKYLGYSEIKIDEPGFVLNVKL